MVTHCCTLIGRPGCEGSSQRGTSVSARRPYQPPGGGYYFGYFDCYYKLLHCFIIVSVIITIIPSGAFSNGS